MIIFLILDFFVLNIILNKEETTDPSTTSAGKTTDTTKTDDKTGDTTDKTTDDGTTYELENITEEERKEFITWTNIYRCMHGSPALKWN